MQRKLKEAISLASRNPRILQWEDEQCLICFESPARALLAPCAHCDLCPDCCAKLRAREGYAKCPTCRVPIERVLQMDKEFEQLVQKVEEEEARRNGRPALVTA